MKGGCFEKGVTSEVKTQGVGQNSQVFSLYKCSGRCYFKTKILFCKTHIASFLMSINRATECWLMHFPSLPVLCFFNGTFWSSVFFSEKPCQMDHLDRILLSGIYNVRKGKTQLHKWAERLVVLCGTCLIVSSVKDCQTGKMHILPLVGGKVRFKILNINLVI